MTEVEQEDERCALPCLRLHAVAAWICWKLRRQSKRRRPKETEEAQKGWLFVESEAWSNKQAVRSFERNVDPSIMSVVQTRGGTRWVTSSHCFQCALNTIHECADFGQEIKTFPDIKRKWITAQISADVHYPRVRYIVSYPPNTPQLPYHDHPGGEECECRVAPPPFPQMPTSTKVLNDTAQPGCLVRKCSS